MLNIQIRGMKVETNISSITEEQINVMMKQVAKKKSSLAELMLKSHFSKKWDSYNNLGTYKKPFLTDNTEIIITAFDENDYYGDGYSFYREKISNLIQKPIFENFNIMNNVFFMVNYANYYGCVFETELNELSYKDFNPDYLSISSINIPFPKQTLIDELFLNNLPLIDIDRSKLQLVKFKSVLYKRDSNIITPFLDEDESNSLEFLVSSEKTF